MKTAGSPLQAVSARGARIYLKNKRSVIDAVSSWWVITLGHCEPAIVRAVRQQAQTMDQVLFANFSHQPAVALVKELSRLLPKELAYLFFSDDGSTAVESALKMAVQSWKQKQKKGPARNAFISFTHSYHGDTIGAMSLSGPSMFTAPYKKLLFPVIRAKQGRYSYDSPSRYIADFEKNLKKYHRRLAGVIIEPLIQGAGGMVMWPKAAVKEICFLTKKYKLYLIFDEVMTGFGRTGELFAFQKLGVVPDILCLSKGLTGGFLPLALTIANADIYNQFLSKKKANMFFHGHSFTGNPLSCAAAAANIKKLNRKNFKKEWARIHNVHQKKIKSFKESKHCIDARVCGTIAALEWRLPGGLQGYGSQFAEQLTKNALQKGVFLRPLGNIIYILPPYCISNKELAQVWDVIEEELKALKY